MAAIGQVESNRLKKSAPSEGDHSSGMANLSKSNAEFHPSPLAPTKVAGDEAVSP
jgi:hypothetical protein